jgi:hypothetical protein
LFQELPSLIEVTQYLLELIQIRFLHKKKESLELLTTKRSILKK